MNKDYVITKLAAKYIPTPLEEGILEPELVPITATVGTAKGLTLGAVLGGLLGALDFKSSNMQVTDSRLRGKYMWDSILKKGKKGALIGGTLLGLGAYLAAKDRNDMKKNDPKRYLVDTGIILDTNQRQ